MPEAKPGPPLLQAAFRPMFLAAGLWSGIGLLLWLLMLDGRFDPPSRFAPIAWHVHEMLFGFVMASIAGFLLTAIPNWTGRTPVSGTPLAILSLFWLVGRIACLVSGVLPVWAAPVLDLLFPVTLGLIAGRELVGAGNRRNYPLLVPITLLSVANLLMHLQSIGVPVPEGIGWRLGLGCVMALIAVIGGRVVPSFTRNWLRARARPGRGGLPTIGEPDRLDTLALAALAGGLVAWVVVPMSSGAGVALLAASGLHLLRLSRWRGLSTRAEPLLFVLHAGYFWMALGVGLLGLSVLTPLVPPAAAIHAMTAGAIGTMTLAVMTRATLGHTGRALRADAATTLIFVLVGLAALARLASAWPSGVGLELLMGAGAGWVAAFGLFAWRYGPIFLARHP